MKKILKNKKGQLMLYISFIVFAIVVVAIAGVIVPMGTLFNAKMYAAGEDILADANVTISQINDVAVRNAILNSTASAMAAGENNITVLNDIYKYSWILILGVGALIIFLVARRMVEYGSSGLV